MPISQTSTEVKDEHHSMGELYDHRMRLFIALRHFSKTTLHGWKSLKHSDDTMFEGGWFIAGLDYAPGHQITYHFPIKYWDDFHEFHEYPRAFPFDGHTPDDVLVRLKGLVDGK